MINAIIIEDEASSMEYLVSILLHNHENIEIIGWASDVESAVALIKRKKPEIVFLDIQLNEGNGFQVLDKLQHQMTFEVIFTTGFLDYKGKAMDYFAFYYLNKPIQPKELEKVLNMYELKRTAFDERKYEAYKLQIKKKEEAITLIEKEGYTSVKHKNIVYCEASGSYTSVILDSGAQLIVSKNLKQLQDMLEQEDFFRVHRSFLVNINHIQKFTNDGVLTLSNGDIIKTSSRNRKKLVHFLSLYNSKNY